MAATASSASPIIYRKLRKRRKQIVKVLAEQVKKSRRVLLWGITIALP
jgi:hypothetical protein